MGDCLAAPQPPHALRPTHRLLGALKAPVLVLVLALVCCMKLVRGDDLLGPRKSGGVDAPEDVARATRPADPSLRDLVLALIVTYGAHVPSTATPDVRVVPANEASWEDLQAVFGARGPAATCQCQRYKLRPREAFRKFPAEERARRLRRQTAAGDPEADATSGLVAYLDGEPVGWCAVEPRPAYTGLLRNNRVPWEGRAEDKGDDSVWAVTCVFTRAGFRRRRIAYALVRAAVEFARERGACALEAYPMILQPGQNITWDELHVGTRSIFEAAGLVEVSHPTIRRVVMRIDF